MAVQSGEQVSTRLSDLEIAPELISANVILRMLDRNAFLRSGIMVQDPTLNAFLNSNLGGKTIAPRYLGPLPKEYPNISNDNPADRSTPSKISGFKSKAVRQSLNKSWSSMDLNASLLGTDPIDAIELQFADYWSYVATTVLLASLRGVAASDLASGKPELTLDISGETGADALFNADAFIDVKNTMGDMKSTLTQVAMHSTVYGTMQKLNLIDYIPDARGEVNIPTYQGMRVIEDDAMTFEPGSDGGAGKYYTYLFAPGAVSFGSGTPKTPYALARDEAAGNGGGEEIVVTRYDWIIHPQGFAFGLDETPNMEQLVNGANWTRVFERKRVPLAILVSQG